MNMLILGMMFSMHMASAAMNGVCPKEQANLVGVSRDVKVTFSEDCKTLYVHPTLEQVQVAGVATSMSLQLCPGFNSSVNGAAQFKKENDQQGLESAMLLVNDLQKMEAGTAQVIVNGNYDQLVRRYQELNPTLNVRGKAMEDFRLEAAPVVIKGISLDRTFGVQVPGGLSTYGTVSASVSLTMAALCPYVGAGKLMKKLNAEDLGLQFVEK